jgi:hypothetical protein
MNVVDIPCDRKVCATCKHWDGARERGESKEVRCLKHGEGVCQLKKHQNHGILDAITTCENGENCPLWENLWQ